MSAKFHKFLFVIPNLVTITGIFLGFSSIIISATATSRHDFFKAAVAIVLAMICDVFDGRVARLTKTSSEFGIQLDSLADIVSFGVAPAVLVYQWGLTGLGAWGIFGAALFLIAGAMRLARFNVHAAHGRASGQYFLGLPIPGAAAMVVALVILHTQLSVDKVNSPINVMWVVIILAYLMVSNVRYRNFKNVRPNKKTLALGTFILISAWLLAIKLSPAFMLMALISAYISMGLIEEFILYPKPKIHLRRKKAKKSPPMELEEDPIDLEIEKQEELLEEAEESEEENEEDIKRIDS